MSPHPIRAACVRPSAPEFRLNSRKNTERYENITNRRIAQVGYGRLRCDRQGMGAHQARQQKRSLHRSERRFVRRQYPGGRRAGEVRRRDDAPHHHGRLHPRRRPAREVARRGAGRRGAGRGHRDLRHGRPRDLPVAEEGSLARIPARHRLPASAHQHLRRGAAHPSRNGLCHP